MIICYRQPKTQRGKRALQRREPKIHETIKTAMLIKGGNTSQLITNVLKELVSGLGES
jgi:ribosome production factor 2